MLGLTEFATFLANTSVPLDVSLRAMRKHGMIIAYVDEAGQFEPVAVFEGDTDFVTKVTAMATAAADRLSGYDTVYLVSTGQRVVLDDDTDLLRPRAVLEITNENMPVFVCWVVSTHGVEQGHLDTTGHLHEFNLQASASKRAHEIHTALRQLVHPGGQT